MSRPRQQKLRLRVADTPHPTIAAARVLEQRLAAVVKARPGEDPNDALRRLEQADDPMRAALAWRLIHEWRILHRRYWAGEDGPHPTSAPLPLVLERKLKSWNAC